MMDVREAGWPVSYANPAFETSAGLDLDDLAGEDFWELFECPGKAELDLAAIVGNGDMFETHVFCAKSRRRLTLRLMPASSDRFSLSKATGIPGWVPSQDAPKGTKLGCDVDDDRVVDVTGRDMMYVQDAKCFWFAMVLDSDEADSDAASTYLSSGKASAASSTQVGSGSLKGSSNWGFTSSFGEYIVPNQLSSLKLGPLLGSGSFGKVYRSVLDDHPVAVKVIDCRTRDGGVTSSQLDEVKLTADLDHPHVVKMFKHASSTENVDGNIVQLAWIVQELCDLGQLSEACERGWLRVERNINSPPDMAKVLPTLRDIAEAMEYVHSRNIVHADLTGRNVLLASCERVPRGFVAKVCDFGLSRLTKGGEAISTSELGTITHMPPEMLMKNMLSPQADVWAFGIVAWEAYFGKKIYCGKKPPQIIMTVVKNIPLEWPADTPKEFTSVIGNALAYEVEERPQFTSIIKGLDWLISLDLKVHEDPSAHLVKKSYN